MEPEQGQKCMRQRRSESGPAEKLFFSFDTLVNMNSAIYYLRGTFSLVSLGLVAVHNVTETCCTEAFLFPIVK